MDSSRLKRLLKRIIKIIIILIVAAVVVTLIINSYVKNTGSKYIVGESDAPISDVVLILGAYVRPNGDVSSMLNDRLTVGLELYQQGKASKIIVSGDHGTVSYDEVNAMKQYLMDRGVKDEDIFMDHAGFSTYESMYRARDIFQVKKLLIVTQEYHLMRAVFIAHELGMEAYGVASDRHDYGKVMGVYGLREIAAREKDFFKAKVFKPEPTYLGEVIPVSGDGRITNDK